MILRISALKKCCASLLTCCQAVLLSHFIQCSATLHLHHCCTSAPAARLNTEVFADETFGPLLESNFNFFFCLIFVLILVMHICCPDLLNHRCCFQVFHCGTSSLFSGLCSLLLVRGNGNAVHLPSPQRHARCPDSSGNASDIPNEAFQRRNVQHQRF